MSTRSTIRHPLHIAFAAVSGAACIPFLRRTLRKAAPHCPPHLEEVSIALVGDKRMSDLHVRFMGIEGPTDVLTFPLDEDARGRVTSGEVVICVPEARRRSRAEGTELREELLLYALHGILHLCGFDDRTAADFARMHRMEDRILKAIGVGVVFARPAPMVRRKPARGRTGRQDGAH